MQWVKYVLVVDTPVFKGWNFKTARGQFVHYFKDKQLGKPIFAETYTKSTYTLVVT